MSCKFHCLKCGSLVISSHEGELCVECRTGAEVETSLWGNHLDVLSEQISGEVVNILMALTDASDWNEEYLKGLVESAVYRVLKERI